jgi:uncharacterized membrane protein
MKAVPHLWQRHPAITRVLAVALLAVPAIVVGTLLFQNDYDPWIIVAVVVVFAFTARWLLERAGRKG